MTGSLRLGDIQFLNSWPVTYALWRGKLGRSFGESIRLVSGVPAELNRKLLTGELDAGAVSSMAYLRHAQELVPVPGLCIRSDSGVASVLLISRFPMEELAGRTLGVSNQGATTPVLLKLLLRRRRLNASLEISSLRYPEILEEYPAALLIGDEALKASRETQELYRWDLGKGWTDWTGLPFVYALWVVRRSLAQADPAVLDQVRQALEESLAWGKSHQRELVIRMQEQFPWEGKFLRDYLDRLSYDLDGKAWRGLRRFALEAQKIGELPGGITRRIRTASLRGLRAERSRTKQSPLQDESASPSLRSGSQ